MTGKREPMEPDRFMALVIIASFAALLIAVGFYFHI